VPGLEGDGKSGPRYLLTRGVVVAAISVAMLGSSAPSPIYGLYQARLGINHVWLTAIYGIYSLGTVFALILLGRISDRIPDRRLLIYAALAAAGIGAVLMAFAHSVPALLIGRFFAGMGTGCIMGPATAALIELDPARDRVRAAITATVAVTGGITSGVVITAAALATGFAPTLSPFVLLASLSVLLLLALRAAPWTPPEVPLATAHLAAPAIKPRVGALVREAGKPFVISCAGMATAWMAGGCFLALGAIFARQLAGIHDPAVAALTVAVFQIVAGSAQLGGRNFRPRTLAMTGAVLMATGLLLATAAAALAASWLFCLGALATGLGYGCCFSGAAAISSHSAPARGRATIVSFTYIAGYLGNLIPVMLLGVIADRFGLFAAIASLAGAVTLAGLLLTLSLARLRLA
jgi:MFS family permease